MDAEEKSGISRRGKKYQDERKKRKGKKKELHTYSLLTMLGKSLV